MKQEMFIRLMPVEVIYRGFGEGPVQTGHVETETVVVNAGYPQPPRVSRREFGLLARCDN